ncbi:hypothetical protein H9N28_03380 [Rhodobacter capsulatus]|uniref:hypothetical protein n=1 Tax=Rhodobacter capsulatus TaxID=1061 RepID=UPI0006DC8D15|nr:hypothetical protein [Rhodobacter capsulatus]KQB15294.1 hypothetical protein AP073_14605 [Rhodobacter capsulatus]KQB16104.1 hypothetical protein AP071_13110 [Rhodobacter capsulatus]PZX25584.1 hypothetical protein LY44_01367 [Rhodobacter capsulatus]QNR63891.1 hypothetical protein H9N28_03380 [Rhodobacter capsulatus]
MRKLTPEDQACLEAARRIVCGDQDDILVFEDGSLLVHTAHFKLRPSRDATDALIIATAKVMKLHLRGVDLGDLREKLLGRDVSEDLADFANFVHEHLVSFSVEDWDAIRARAGWYAEFNVETALPDTDKAGDS